MSHDDHSSSDENVSETDFTVEPDAWVEAPARSADDPSRLANLTPAEVEERAELDQLAAAELYDWLLVDNVLAIAQGLAPVPRVTPTRTTAFNTLRINTVSTLRVPDPVDRPWCLGFNLFKPLSTPLEAAALLQRSLPARAVASRIRPGTLWTQQTLDLGPLIYRTLALLGAAPLAALPRDRLSAVAVLPAEVAVAEFSAYGCERSVVRQVHWQWSEAPFGPPVEGDGVLVSVEQTENFLRAVRQAVRARDAGIEVNASRLDAAMLEPWSDEEEEEEENNIH